MFIANVIRPVHVTQAVPCLQEQHFLLAETKDTTLVAVNLVGAVPGDRVLLVTGTAAARYCMDAPVNAAAVAIVNEKP